MPKIKRKVEMALPKLIQWVWENEFSDKAFIASTQEVQRFRKEQTLYLEHETRKDDTFTVEVEEEITEETQIYRLLELRDSFTFKDGGWKDLNILKSYMYGNHSISEVKMNIALLFICLMMI